MNYAISELGSFLGSPEKLDDLDSRTEDVFGLNQTWGPGALDLGMWKPAKRRTSDEHEKVSIQGRVNKIIFETEVKLGKDCQRFQRAWGYHVG